jgi:uracil-DNA glycosylase
MNNTLTWDNALAEHRDSQQYKQAISFSLHERELGKTIYPPQDLVFNALQLTPLENVRVVILGQDPYHGPNQAEGLAFSVPQGVAIPPSLKNIFKELQSNLGIPPPIHGHLSHWCEQGVLLLNSVLTVEAGKPGSHAKYGWEFFTDSIIKTVSTHNEHIVFLLWGSFAQKKRVLIDESKHLVLVAPHPSPLSAYHGFFGCRHFSQANDYLIQSKKTPIDWNLP